MTAFERATAVTPVSEGRWHCELDPDWSIGDKPHGGYTMATLTRAALLAAGRPHPLAVSTHFLRPPAFAPAEVHTEVIRSGRTVSTVGARLVQDGKVCLEAVVTAGELRDEDHEWSGVEPPHVTPVEECYTGDKRPGPPMGLRKYLDLRMDPETLGWVAGTPTGNAEMRGWLDSVDGSAADPLALIVVVDALPPVVLELGHAGWAPTVELTFLLRGLPAPGWLRTVCHATALSADGWFDENAQVWDARGRLVAQSRQLALAGSVLSNR